MPKQFMAKKREPENSQAPEMLSTNKTKNSNTEQLYFRKRQVNSHAKNCPGCSLWNYCRHPMLVHLINGISQVLSNLYQSGIVMTLYEQWEKVISCLSSLISLNYLELRICQQKQRFYSHSIDILENRTSEIISNTYLTLIFDIVGNCSNLANGVLLIINVYALGVIWGNSYFFLFDSHSKNSSGNICQNGTKMLYFQIPFINLPCSSEAIKVSKLEVALERRLSFPKQKYSINVEPKKNLQSKFYVQNKSSVAKEEKLKKKMKTGLNFSRSKYGRDHISFVQLVTDVFIQGLCSFFLC